jgi:hypothetical protein
MAVTVEGGLAIAALALAVWLGVPLRRQFPDSGLSAVWSIALGLAATLPMLCLFWWLVHSQRSALQQLRQQVEWLVGEIFPSRRMAQLGLVALLAGVGEELFFRGVIQYKLAEWMTPLAGLVLTSVLFGLAHALSRLYFLLATLIGLYFGWLALRYNLLAPMTAHAVYDFAALMYLSRSGRRQSAPAPVQKEADDEPAEHPIDHV